MSRVIMLAVVCLVIALTSASWAEPVVSVEDLKGAELPHGIVVLPRQGSDEARRLGGCIFRFSDAAFQAIPEKNGEQGGNDLFQTVRERNLGDLTYSPMNEGTFISWSGRIADLGGGFLSELDGKKLIQPPLVYSVEERSGSTGKGYEGFLEHLVEGHRYLLRTTDGKFALLRLLEKGRSGAVFQWLYQADGTRMFSIPTADPKAYTAKFGGSSDRPSVPPVATGDTTVTGLKEAPLVQIGNDVASDPRAFATMVEQYLRNRKLTIETLIALVENGDGRTKSLAIRTLGDLRATEAAPVLAARIAWLDSWSKVLEATIEGTQPCVPALIGIGLPGAQAALDEISRVDDPAAEGQRRLKLLSLVVLRVYEEKLANFVLEDRAATVKTDKERENFERAKAAIPEIRGWR